MHLCEQTVERFSSCVCGFQVDESGAVYLAAVLEYHAAELLELAGNAARDNRQTSIINRHLYLAVANDAELETMYL